MKDLRFTGTMNGVEVDVTYRTDLIHADAENFTVSQIQEGAEFSSQDNPDQKAVMSEIKRLPYSVSFFTQYAEDNNLNLTIANSDGSDLEYLATAEESGS